MKKLLETCLVVGLLAASVWAVDYYTETYSSSTTTGYNYEDRNAVGVAGDADTVDGYHAASFAFSSSTVAGFVSVAVATTTEANARISADAALGISTASLRTDVNAKASLEHDHDNIYAGQDVYGTIDLIYNGWQTEIVDRAAADAAVISATTTLRTDLSSEIAARAAADTEIKNSTYPISAITLAPSKITAGILPSNVAVTSITTGNYFNDVKVSSSICADSAKALASGSYVLSTSSMTLYQLTVSSLIANGFVSGSGGTGVGVDSLSVGDVVITYSTDAIQGDFLYADGRAVSRTTYAALFSAIGTKAGAGDGSTTFNLPDFRGVVPRGFDGGRGFDADGNRVIFSTQTDMLASHTHNANIYISDSGTLSDTRFKSSAGGDNGVAVTLATGGAETRGKNIAVGFKIKYRLSTSTTTAIYDSTGTFTAPQSAPEIITTYGFFHDRGDPASADLTQAEMTTDGNWHDFDMSSIVPDGAKAVVLMVSIMDDVATSQLILRKKGNTNTVSYSGCRTMVANINSTWDLTVPCSTGRVIEYNATAGTWSAISIVVKGWWK
jgi:microcystin-dependent protein